MEKVIVVKIGGVVLGTGDTTIEDIVSLQRQGKRLIIVHGGGKQVNEWLDRRGVEARFVRGERVTDGVTLEVVTAVLGGLVNKEITAEINCRGGRAVGISGVDGGTVRCRIRSEEMGYVGDVVEIDTALPEALLEAGYLPIMSPVSLNFFDKTPTAPAVLNVNGDPLAGEIAAAIKAAELIFLTDVDGVRDGAGELIGHLSPVEAEALVASGVVKGGMIPKIRACLKALPVVPVTRIIDGRQRHALLKEVAGEKAGTTISE